VVAGAGGYNTAEVTELAKEVGAVGADGILSVTPYYNKPSQEGIYQHFKAIAHGAKLPMIVYNIQGRSAVNIETATMKRLSEIDYIVGVKEASGNISQMAAVIHQVSPDFAVLSGDDAITIPLIALGGRGVIATVANQIPKEMTQLAQRALANDFAGAREIQRKFLPLMEANGFETNPIPVKASMALMGLLEPIWRLPMCPPSQANLARIEKVLETLGLLADRSVHAG
jgi:4-hydroxy-tetrahydrodipicolinate synthase